MLIMTGHYVALPSTSLSQSVLNYKAQGCGPTSNSVLACVEHGYLSATKEKKTGDRQTQEWSLVLLNINI